ncbi:3-deoxy-D-manno-octulosonic acid transferase [Brevundimonas intermedia]|uniref:3-deoxy-D-manno-octulosonic acid transferase n=1 Tax=Brevundimonas intermedia TaxID=74315 RepID=A0A4Y9RUI8_9CAUL|nr:3-deoxy-D-manno-octulosonic acid transferase [Brevundimonas intermedia]TFW12622.1 3-deoxy-D-manno-octulosonic acid transferase [Brevundimonas intermedia]
MTPLPLIAYRLATRALEPLAPRLLDARARRGKEDPVRVDERMGFTRTERPAGDLVWLHGVSVGESLSLLPVVERLVKARPDLTVLVTSSTVTSAQILAQRLPKGVIHQYAPVDAPGVVERFLDHWRPGLAVFVESEIWPNLLLEAHRRGVKLALVSARITEKTVEGWARFPASARALTGAFDLILPQDAVSAQRLESMGARIDGLVNLKLSGDPLPHDPAAFSRLSAAIGDRPVIVAASTHESEEVAIVRALDRLGDRVCLILAPRHPERGPHIAQALQREGYAFAMRSRGEVIGPDTDIYLADTLNEMGLFLRLADMVVMGGSFAPALGLPPVGGHNPLEPARLGKPTITGPDASNWAPVTSALAEAGGLVLVQAPWDLPGVIEPLLADLDAAKAMGERGRRAAVEAGGGLERLWSLLAPLMPQRQARR